MKQGNYTIEENAKANCVLLLQRRLLQQQAEFLQECLTGNRTEAETDTVISVPQILLDRSQADEMAQHHRLVDDVELTILGILNSDGVVSLNSRVQELIVVMTRLTKVNESLLFFEISSF